MKNKTLVISIGIMLFFGLGIFIGSQAGCERKKRELEVIGFPRSFADLAEKVKPAVVNISTETTVTIPGNPFKHFFGHEGQEPFGDFFERFSS
jgi:serine protease Do